MRNKGITLIALVITIIVLMILSGVSLSLTIGENGILSKATEAKTESDKATFKEKLKIASIELEEGKTLEWLEEELIKDGVNYIRSNKFIFVSKDDLEYTILEDGTIIEGKVAYLDIADGNIDLYSNGYKQYIGNLQNLNKTNITTHTGKYIITGTTTENVVRVCDEGNYDITIKNLNIDARDSNYCAINANKAKKAVDCNVNIILEENNVLRGGNGPGLGWVGATPNVDGVTNGSTLTIGGNGYLEVYGGNKQWTSAIGNCYSGGDASGDTNNIIINGGNIKAQGSTNGSGIGGALYKKTNNIVINGGNIEAIGTNCAAGIGVVDGIADNIIINGGNIIAKGYLGPAIGGGTNSGTLKITGGNIYAAGGAHQNFSGAAIGCGMQNISIEGGTIRTKSTKHAGMFKNETNNVRITGGNLQLGGIGDIGMLDSDKSFVQGFSTDGTNNLYMTPIKLQDVGENKKIESLTTSDNIEYGTKDMYTFEDDTSTTGVDETGMIYLYLPLGSRTITINVDGRSYEGTVETKVEAGEVVVLNKI